MWVGLTTAVRIFPEVAFGSLARVLADRADRRVLMLGADAIRVVTMALLTLVAVAHAPVVLAPLLAAAFTVAASVYPPRVVAVPSEGTSLNSTGRCTATGSRAWAQALQCQLERLQPHVGTLPAGECLTS